jgi:hypothetical protein
MKALDLLQKLEMSNKRMSVAMDDFITSYKTKDGKVIDEARQKMHDQLDSHLDIMAECAMVKEEIRG